MRYSFNHFLGYAVETLSTMSVRSEPRDNTILSVRRDCRVESGYSQFNNNQFNSNELNSFFEYDEYDGLDADDEVVKTRYKTERIDQYKAEVRKRELLWRISKQEAFPNLQLNFDTKSVLEKFNNKITQPNLIDLRECIQNGDNY